MPLHLNPILCGENVKLWALRCQTFKNYNMKKHVLLFEWFANVCCLKGGSCDGEPTVKIRHFNFQHFPVSLVRIYSKHSQH